MYILAEAWRRRHQPPEIASGLTALGEDEVVALNRVLRRTRSLEQAAAEARDPAAALAHLRAADRVVQVDDFGVGEPW